jgi:hypothetical protein
MEGRQLLGVIYGCRYFNSNLALSPITKSVPRQSRSFMVWPKFPVHQDLGESDFAASSVDQHLVKQLETL